ncbi:MAG: UDP-3-O-[3-hydroxymyristoyl] N-acetylglucosamine deacetylase [Chlamydiales bacterium]|nr:UDP-3-O-[3-hydroxymyristoyl] N-acetylglucosamine deacetylase [Chlamydiales bacterium]
MTIPEPKILRNQQTLASEVDIAGIGLFSGLTIKMRFVPAPAGTGIVFKRIDLKHEPIYAASLQNLAGTPRCTNLGDGKVIIQSVEHVLSALTAYHIDNLIIELDGPEIPAVDGSSTLFVELIERGGILVQEQLLQVHKLDSPVFWSKGDIYLVGLPSDELKISYTLSYKNHPLLDSQYFSTIINTEVYKREIAACRTFSLYEEIVGLLDQGLIKGGSLESGVIIKGDQVMNPGGLRFPNEMVRHKVLDLMGDLSLVGFPFIAHIIAIKSGHHSNTEFAKQLAFKIKGSKPR